MATLNIVLLPGDGVGPEVCHSAVRVLERIASRYQHDLEIAEQLIGYVAWEAAGSPLPEATLTACLNADAALLGAVGDPRANELTPLDRPEGGLLALRKALGAYANLRPAKVDPSLVSSSALKPELASSVDFVIVRELTGGIYYGESGVVEGGAAAFDTMKYSVAEIERLARVGFDVARTRRSAVTSIDKANVLEVSRLWRSTVESVAVDYPDVTVNHMFVDRAAMELVLAPSQFDVILTGNMFGDILSDEAAAVCGTLGVLGSACIGGAVGLYEPVHGSAPDIAGKDLANPIGVLVSTSMMLRHSFGLHTEADAIDRAISQVLADGLRTADTASPGESSLGTRAFTDAIVEALS